MHTSEALAEVAGAARRLPQVYLAESVAGRDGPTWGRVTGTGPWASPVVSRVAWCLGVGSPSSHGMWEGRALTPLVSVEVREGTSGLCPKE